MKRKIYIFVLFVSLFFIFESVKAEDFYEAEYFNVYVNKVKGNKTYYLTMRALRDRENDNILVYCLEPFKFFEDDSKYRFLSSNEYSLSKEQMDLIRRIAYYGYGYAPKHRITYAWYIVTQVLIWRVVDPSADIYFTKTLNGIRDDDKLRAEMDELTEDVYNNAFEMDLNGFYNVVYNRNLEIKLNNDYEVLDSNYDYNYDNGVLKIDNIKKEGHVTIKENANKAYQGREIIYDSDLTQDLYLPGSFEDKVFTINIDVILGDITLNIFKDKETYSVDADFSNTCYGIFKGDNLIQKVCANDEYKYRTGELELGDYIVKQISHGEGYVEDDNVYTVSINENNLNPVVNLYNRIVEGRIYLTKKYCDLDKCSLEGKAKFEVYDSKNNLVNGYNTDNSGNISFVLGYGKYDIVQTDGLSGYSFVNSFNIFISEESNYFSYDLYDKKIEEETKQEIIDEEEIEEKEEVLNIEEPEEVINDIEVEKSITRKTEEVVLEVVEEMDINEENVCDDIIEELTPPDTGIVLVLKNNKWVKMFYDNFWDIIRRYARFAILL